MTKRKRGEMWGGLYQEKTENIPTLYRMPLHSNQILTELVDFLVWKSTIFVIFVFDSPLMS